LAIALGFQLRRGDEAHGRGVHAIPKAGGTRTVVEYVAEMGIGTQPEIIKGPDFYEIIAEIRGLTGIADIRTDYNSDTKIMNIYTPRSNEPEVSVKLPNDASDLKVDQVQYLNGILRIRLVKQI